MLSILDVGTEIIINRGFVLKKADARFAKQGSLNFFLNKVLLKNLVSTAPTNSKFKLLVTALQ